jgi:hypothetical protein
VVLPEKIKWFLQKSPNTPVASIREALKKGGVDV